MKKYVIIPLLFLPVMSMAAPSVKKLGVVAPVASAGVKSATATKVTPARTASSARVGSMHVKPVAAAAATTGAISASTSRFPMILPAKSYSGASTPKKTAVGSNIINNNVDMKCGDEEVCTTLENHDERISNNKQTIKENTDRIEAIEADMDTVAIGFDNIKNNTRNLDGRAWIWVEEVPTTNP